MMSHVFLFARTTCSRMSHQGICVFMRTFYAVDVFVCVCVCPSVGMLQCCEFPSRSCKNISVSRRKISVQVSLRKLCEQVLCASGGCANSPCNCLCARTPIELLCASSLRKISRLSSRRKLLCTSYLRKSLFASFSAQIIVASFSGRALGACFSAEVLRASCYVQVLCAAPSLSLYLSLSLSLQVDLCKQGVVLHSNMPQKVARRPRCDAKKKVWKSSALLVDHTDPLRGSCKHVKKYHANPRRGSFSQSGVGPTLQFRAHISRARTSRAIWQDVSRKLFRASSRDRAMRCAGSLAQFAARLPQASCSACALALLARPGSACPLLHFDLRVLLSYLLALLALHLLSCYLTCAFTCARCSARARVLLSRDTCSAGNSCATCSACALVHLALRVVWLLAISSEEPCAMLSRKKGGFMLSKRVI